MLPSQEGHPDIFAIFITEMGKAQPIRTNNIKVASYF
jgi:hypothetical protein